MDGKLAPTHRKKRKYIYWDLFASAVVILVVELAFFLSWTVYYCIMLWSYYDNGGRTTKFLVEEENGHDVKRPAIPEDVMYYFLLIGLVFSIAICLLLFLGTVWLFPDFLILWKQGTVLSNTYFLVVYIIDGIFSRGSFPGEVFIIPVRFYFIFVIGAFAKQIKDDEKHDYDYKRFAEDHFRETQTKFVARNRGPTSWFEKMFVVCCGFTGCAKRQTYKIAPTEFADKDTVMRHMRVDMDLEQNLSSIEVEALDLNELAATETEQVFD